MSMVLEKSKRTPTVQTVVAALKTGVSALGTGGQGVGTGVAPAGAPAREGKKST